MINGSAYKLIGLLTIVFFVARGLHEGVLLSLQVTQLGKAPALDVRAVVAVARAAKE